MARLILHVDDDPRLPEGVRQALEGEGYEWIHSTDPEQVMRLVETRRPDLVLMELDLSECDGPDLVGGIRAYDVPVLVLTRLPRDTGVHGEAIAHGVVDFLTKPVLASELLANIREAAPPPAPEPSPSPGPSAAASPAELSGGLRDWPVPELLARLRRRGATGVLKLQCGDARVGVQLRNGTPICVAAKGRAAAGSREPGDEAEALLFETFGWTSGAFEFFEGGKLRPDTALEIAGDPAGLLVRGVLAASPPEWVRERLRKRATLFVSPKDPDEEPLDGLELTPQQATILGELAGQDALADLLDSNAFEERMLYGLWVAGRIELHAEPTINLTEVYEEGLEVPAESEADSEDLSEVLRKLAQQVMAGDAFKALGVPVDASEEELRKAYERQLARIPERALDGSDLGLRARVRRIRERIETAYARLKDPESRSAYSLLRKEEDQDGDAKRQAQRALEGERWFRKGKGHLERRRYDEAAEAFGMASHLDPSEGEYLSHLGYALFLSKSGNKIVQREAMEHVANGIKRSPTRELSYVFLGRILKARGEEKAAMKVFRRALKIKPECHPALQEIRLIEMRSTKVKGKGVLKRFLGK